MNTSPKTSTNMEHFDDGLSQEMSNVQISGKRQKEIESENMVIRPLSIPDASMTNERQISGTSEGLETEVNDDCIKPQEEKRDNSLVNSIQSPVVDGVEDVKCNGSDGLKALINTKLQTISQYMTLVQNPKSHSMLLKENTITGFLVLCLGDDVPQVVQSSLEVFQVLSKYEENLPMIKNLDYILDALRCVASNSYVNDSVRKEARNIVAKLKSISLKNTVALSELSESMKNVMASSTTSGNCGSSSAVNNIPIKKSTDLNSTMSTMKRKNKGRETILFVENDILQRKSERARITLVLMGAPGIISVTYNLKQNYCIIRGKRNVASEDFGRAVAKLGLAKVYLVRKNENNEEVRTLIQADEKENVAYPAYPEELETDEIDNSAAVAKHGQVPAENASFLKSAKNFIKRSFYW